VAYYRALSKRESNHNPSEANLPAYGLMQVVRQVVDSYNQRFGTSYAHADMLNPEANVKVAAELIERISQQFGKLHPQSKNMRPDWSNPEHVRLVTSGWNSGYSEKGGVGRVAGYLESKGIPVTHENVFKYWQQAGASKPGFLNSQQKYDWQRSVADLYMAQPDRATGIGKFLVMTAIAGAVAYGFYKLLPGKTA
jgi:hypothetical protein